MANDLDILKLYNSTKAHQPSEARKIPGLTTDDFDREHKVADGFTTFAKPGDPTKFTTSALNNFDVLLQNLTPPPSFVPLVPESPFPLNRWSEKSKYADFKHTPNN